VETYQVSAESSVDSIDEKLMELQQELVKKTNSKEVYDEIAEQIFEIREQRQQATMDTVQSDEQISHITDLQDFIKAQTADLTEFDEALMGELMPADSEQGRIVLSQISPILWILAGIMCGSAAATCTTISRTSKHHSTLSITDQLLGRIAVAVLASLLASAPLVSTSPSRLWAAPGHRSMPVITFLCGFAMTSLAGMAPFISWIYLAIPLGRYYPFDNAEAAGTYLADILPIPLLAISATAGLFTMYHYKKPRPITSSQSTEP